MRKIQILCSTVVGALHKKYSSKLRVYYWFGRIKGPVTNEFQWFIWWCSSFTYTLFNCKNSVFRSSLSMVLNVIVEMDVLFSLLKPTIIMRVIGFSHFSYSLQHHLIYFANKILAVCNGIFSEPDELSICLIRILWICASLPCAVWWWWVGNVYVCVSVCECIYYLCSLQRNPSHFSNGKMQFSSCTGCNAICDYIGFSFSINLKW